MDLKQLSELGGEVNVTVRLEDLRQWDKGGYLVPVEYGGQRRYRVADVQRILNGDSYAR